MNIAVIDDVPQEREKIQRILTAYSAQNRLPLSVSAFGSAEEFMESYRPLLYSAVFLDIYLDSMSGIEAARQLREIDRDTLLVFLTTSEDHMPDAFRLHAFEYILKPVTRENLYPLLDDILRRTTPIPSQGFHFTSRQGDVVISYDDLVMVGTQAHNYLEILDKDGNSRLTRMAFHKAAAVLLKDKRFLLLRRGVLVNMAYILAFDPDAKVCRLSVGDPVPFSTRNQKSLEQIWDNYLLDKMRFDTLRGMKR